MKLFVRYQNENSKHDQFFVVSMDGVTHRQLFLKNKVLSDAMPEPKIIHDVNNAVQFNLLLSDIKQKRRKVCDTYQNIKDINIHWKKIFDRLVNRYS